MQIKNTNDNSDLFGQTDFMTDCPNSQFIPTVLPPVKRIIAIGDIHGDLQLAIRCFKLANLIDDNFNWIANPPNTVVVQVGDQVDSCRPIPNVYECRYNKYPDDAAEDTQVMDFFDEMNKKAQMVGGAVYSLLGNHELMNSQGRFDYVSFENLHSFNYVDRDNGQIYLGEKGRFDVFKPGGIIAKKMACERISVLVIGSTMFVHAGVLPVLAEKLDYLNVDSTTKLKYLNAVIRKWLLNKINDKTFEQDRMLLVNDIKMSPFWTRIYGSIPKNSSLNDQKCFDSVKKTIQVFKIGKIVVGHTPQLYTNNEGINGTCYEKDIKDNTLYRVDGGFSRAFRIFDSNNIAQVLEILNDTEFNILTDASTKYVEPTDLDINDEQMKNVASVFSQNRLTTRNQKKYDHYKKKMPLF